MPNIPVDEAKSRVERLQRPRHEVHDGPMDLDAGVALDGNAPIHDGLCESDSAADVQDIGVGKRTEPEALGSQVDQGGAGLLVAVYGDGRGVPVQVGRDLEAKGHALSLMKAAMPG